jgi:hypothetical protein
MKASYVVNPPPNICLIYRYVKTTALAYTFMFALSQLEIEPGIRLELNLKSDVTIRCLGLVRGFEIQSLLMILIFYNKNSKHSHNQ